MAVFRRDSSTGKTKEYHYRFMQSGKDYYGVCEGCTTERDALDYEKDRKADAKKLAEQKSVKALIENFRDELAGGGEPIAITDAYELYLTKPCKRKPGAKQTTTKRIYFNDFIAFMAKNYPDITSLRSVTKKHAEEYIYLLKTSGAFTKDIKLNRETSKKAKEKTYLSKASKLSARTINGRHMLLKSVFNRLKDDIGINYNPFDFVMMESDYQSRENFSDDELLKIGNNLSMPFTKPIFIIGLYTGLSLSDICLLKWKSVKDNFICTNRRKTKAYIEIPILPAVKRFLQEQFPTTGNGEYVAPELAQMYLNNPSGLNHLIKKFLEDLKIQTAIKLENRSRAVSNKMVHALRHTFAYLAGVNEVPLMIVQSILGHMSPKMTELYQKHASRHDKQKFLSKMPAALIGDVDAVIMPEVEPEREKFRQLANTLSIKQIKQILKSLEAAK
ncbi:MAG: tyrosine-type recombinase/integrase [Lentisphaerota bacterium]